MPEQGKVTDISKPGVLFSIVAEVLQEQISALVDVEKEGIEVHVSGDVLAQLMKNPFVLRVDKREYALIEDLTFVEKLQLMKSPDDGQLRIYRAGKLIHSRDNLHTDVFKE